MSKQESRDRCVSTRLCPDASSTRVLFIDDEIEWDCALVRLLRKEGFVVECAETGMEGLRRAQSNPPHAIVLDLHLPDILGMTVLSELRKSSLNVPVVIVTGWYIDDGHEQLARAVGADFLRRPLDASHLAAILRRAIASGRAPQRSAFCQPRFNSNIRTEPRVPIGEDSALNLHNRIVTGDQRASEDLAAYLLPKLKSGLRKTFAATDSESLHDAVVEAFLDYLRRPWRYNPERGRLESFLLRASRCNLINRLDSDRRRVDREIETARHSHRATAPEVDAVARAELRRLLEQATTSFTTMERRVLRLWMSGERRTSVFANATGISDASAREQRAQVKQVKDRIVQRLRRWRSRSN